MVMHSAHPTILANIELCGALIVWQSNDSLQHVKENCPLRKIF